MGSKRSLLATSLGPLMLDAMSESVRLIDVFAGSGVVSHFVAQRLRKPVVSGDLQDYSRVLSASVIERTVAFGEGDFFDSWIRRAGDVTQNDERASRFVRASEASSSGAVRAARDLVDELAEPKELLLRAYGGHYFSPMQALFIECLYRSLPSREYSVVAMGALLRAASAASSSPGHTAQPFQPTPALLPHIRSAWANSIERLLRRPDINMLGRHALVRGHAYTADAAALIEQVVEAGDLVFMDPPYSDVQYSRFYHVLEGISQGGYESVHGAGRAPALAERARSVFSRKARAETALMQAIEACLKRRARVMLTLPSHATANNIYSARLIGLLAQRFTVRTVSTPLIHSTLGGASGTRNGRRSVMEDISLISLRGAR